MISLQHVEADEDSPVDPQGIWVWGGYSASTCSQSFCGGLRAAETFPSEAGCDSCGPHYLSWSVQLLMGAILPHDLFGGHTGDGYMSQSDKPHGFPCCSITRGLTTTLVCLDIAILCVQSSPQLWTLPLNGACHSLGVLAVP